MVVSARLVCFTGAIRFLARLCCVGDIARLFLQPGTSTRGCVLLVRLACGSCWPECGEILSRVVGIVSGVHVRLIGRCGGAWLGPGGRPQRRQKSHSILEDMGEVKGARWMMVLAWTALWGLLRADEGLLGGRAGAVHIAKASVKWWRGNRQLELWCVRHGARPEWSVLSGRARCAVWERAARLSAAATTEIAATI